MRNAILSVGTQEWNIVLSERFGCIDTINSYLYICPHCRDIWARLKVEGQWDAWTLGMPCSRCPSFRGEIIPGSLLRNLNHSGGLDLDLQLLRALPPELLAREFDLHVTALEEYDEHDNQRWQHNPLSADPEFAKYFTPSVTWHLPERPGSSSISTYDNRGPDVFTILERALADNLSGGAECSPRSQCDDHGSDRNGEDLPDREPG